MEPSSSNSNTQRCFCAKTNHKEKLKKNTDQQQHSSASKLKSKSKISLSLINFNLRRGKSNKRMKKPDISDSASPSNSELNLNGAVKKSKWGLKLNVKKEKSNRNDDALSNCCSCSCYKKINEEQLDFNKEAILTRNVNTLSVESKDAEGAQQLSDFEDDSVIHVQEIEIREPNVISGANNNTIDENIYDIAVVQPSIVLNAPFMDVHCLRTIHEDCDEAARLARAREIEQGVEAPASFKTVRRVQLLCSDMEENGQKPRRLQLVCPPDLSVDSLKALFHNNVTIRSSPIDNYTGCHTQVDFIHCLVPDLYNITNCSFYWGKIDRYEAERLLDGKPEGTFLLRDSAQEEFLFSVSFRKYDRSLHARIEQWNHKFSFDSHDPGVFTSDTVCGLIEHYKDPSGCMFFEPTLTCPLHRNFPFSLQHLARSVIVSRLTYDDINHLQLPKTLKTYLKEYHYRQKVRVERFDDDMQWLELQNM